MPRAGARDGFTGMMAIHPAQVRGDQCRLHAVARPRWPTPRAIVAAFDADPGAGVLTLDGKMIDRPHLKQALALVARA